MIETTIEEVFRLEVCGGVVTKRTEQLHYEVRDDTDTARADQPENEELAR